MLKRIVLTWMSGREEFVLEKTDCHSRKFTARLKRSGVIETAVSCKELITNNVILNLNKISLLSGQGIIKEET